MKEIISEKSIKSYKDYRVCTFQVDLNANKYSISKLFKSKFNIDPVFVNVVNRLGKLKRNRKNFRKFTMVGSKKIAYIKIPLDKKIDIFEIK
jgi:ribosomal protein L23